MDPNSSLLLGPAQHPTEPCMEGGRSLSPREQSRCSPFAWSQVPSSSLFDPDCFEDEHIQAKRARVETIVQGMFLSPTSLGPGRAPTGDSPSRPEKAQGRKRKQSLPMQQDPLEAGPAGNRGGGGRKGGPRVRGQLHLLRQQMRHLQERILRAVEPRAAAQALQRQTKGMALGLGPGGRTATTAKGPSGTSPGWRNTEYLRSSTCLRGPGFFPLEHGPCWRV